VYKLLTPRLGFQYSKAGGSSAAGPNFYIVTSDFWSDRLKVYSHVPMGLNWEGMQCSKSRFLHECMRHFAVILIRFMLFYLSLHIIITLFLSVEAKYYNSRRRPQYVTLAKVHALVCIIISTFDGNDSLATQLVLSVFTVFDSSFPIKTLYFQFVIPSICTGCHTPPWVQLVHNFKEMQTKEEICIQFTNKNASASYISFGGHLFISLVTILSHRFCFFPPSSS
jgi:hypothetical protein